jgi:hypothetical protein
MSTLNFIGPGVNAQASDDGSFVTVSISGGGGGSSNAPSISVYDEASLLTMTMSSIYFVGSGVNATVQNVTSTQSEVTVTIGGGTTAGTSGTSGSVGTSGTAGSSGTSAVGTSGTSANGTAGTSGTTGTSGMNGGMYPSALLFGYYNFI